MSIATALIGGAISAGTALLGTKMRNEAQKRENEMAFIREREQIREQNAYNSPSAQMARMAAAGLNPNLMYQQGEQGLQSDVAHYTPAELESGVEPLGNVGSQVISDLVGLQDMKNKTALAEADVALKAATTDFQMSASKLNEQTRENMLQKLGFELRGLELKNELSEEDVKIAKKKLDNMDAEYEKMISEKGLNIALANKATAEEREIIALMPSKQEFLNATAAEKREMIKKIALEMEIARLNKWTSWVNTGINAVNAGPNILNVVGTIKKFTGGSSLGDGLVSPWDNLGGSSSYSVPLNP